VVQVHPSPPPYRSKAQPNRTCRKRRPRPSQPVAAGAVSPSSVSRWCEREREQEGVTARRFHGNDPTWRNADQTVVDSYDPAPKPVVGQPYPWPLCEQERARANLLTPTGSVLQIFLPDMSPRDQATLQKGTVRAGFLHADGAILWLFQFLRSGRNPPLTFDCPYDARRLSAAERDIPRLERHTRRRLAIQIHALDDSGILRVIRDVALPSALTAEFLNTVDVQLMSARSGNTAHLLWRRRNPAELAAQCTMHVCSRMGLLGALVSRRR
jgi:hypothetical protein